MFFENLGGVGQHLPHDSKLMTDHEKAALPVYPCVGVSRKEGLKSYGAVQMKMPCSFPYIISWVAAHAYYNKSCTAVAPSFEDSHTWGQHFQDVSRQEISDPNISDMFTWKLVWSTLRNTSLIYEWRLNATIETINLHCVTSDQVWLSV